MPLTANSSPRPPPVQQPASQAQIPQGQSIFRDINEPMNNDQFMIAITHLARQYKAAQVALQTCTSNEQRSNIVQRTQSLQQQQQALRHLLVREADRFPGLAEQLSRQQNQNQAANASQASPSSQPTLLPPTTAAQPVNGAVHTMMSPALTTTGAGMSQVNARPPQQIRPMHNPQIRPMPNGMANGMTNGMNPAASLQPHPLRPPLQPVPQLPLHAQPDLHQSQALQQQTSMPMGHGKLHFFHHFTYAQI